LISGLRLNLVAGYYQNVEKPEGAADGMVSVSFNVIMP
jgi:hypothetical protein